MAEPTEGLRVHPKEIRRRTTPAPASGISIYGLPQEVLQTAAKRLGFLGLIIALMGPSAYLIEKFTQPERLVSSSGIPLQQFVAALLFLAGAAVSGLAWSGAVRRELLLDIGLVFEVVVAFAISLSEHATPWPAGSIRGVSWNCLWISLYVVAIPGTYGKSVLAVVAAACMAPFGMLVASAINRHPIPTPEQLPILLLPPFAVAAWAIPVARHLNRLGAQVSKARAMGSYELLELIGRGGMGEVWRAKHRMLARVSAIKVIRPEALSVRSTENPDILVRRFEREARATANLRSPHTVALYDFGTSEDGSFYYAMELLDGLDLETLVHKFGPLPPGRVVNFLLQVVKSLAEAHDSGLVHRDIKPGNIFTCRMGTDYDFIKVLDFGLVKVSATGDETRLTNQGVTTGTPAYMAPEVAAGDLDIDGRADLYSLGCVGYWLLTGQLVFPAPSVVAMVIAHLHDPPPPPSQRIETPIPASLERAILRCLEKDSEKRPSTARELYGLLAACADVPPWTPEAAEHWWQTHIPQQISQLEDLSVPTAVETS